MLIVRGAFHFRPKRVAFRDDYCLSCRAPRRAVAVRTFDVGHIFWIPILPVGFWRHWVCSVCGGDPHARSKARRYFKWADLLRSLPCNLRWRMLFTAAAGTTTPS